MGIKDKTAVCGNLAERNISRKGRIRETSKNERIKINRLKAALANQRSGRPNNDLQA